MTSLHLWLQSLSLILNGLSHTNKAPGESLQSLFTSVHALGIFGGSRGSVHALHDQTFFCEKLSTGYRYFDILIIRDINNDVIGDSRMLVISVTALQIKYTTNMVNKY